MRVIYHSAAQPVPQLHGGGHHNGRYQGDHQAKGPGARDLLAADSAGQQGGSGEDAAPDVDGTDL